MPDRPTQYQRFEAGSDDPREQYRKISEIRAEQAEQRAEVAVVRAEVGKVGKAVEGVATGQAEIMEFLKGGFKTPGLKNIVEGHGDRLDRLEENHGARIKSLEDSRSQVMPLVEARNERRGLAKLARDNAASTIGGGVVIGLWIAVKAWWESLKHGGHP